VQETLMPFPSSRLDLALVPAVVDRPLATEAIQVLLDAWRSRGILDGSTAGAGASGLVVGGFEAVRVEAFPRVQLWSNQQGGFKAICRSCHENVTGAFSAAVTHWRAGGERQFTCPRCGTLQPLEHALLEPPGAFASWALVIAGAADGEITAAAQLEIEEQLGAMRLVWRRMG
jgi:hypothetical protein